VDLDGTLLDTEPIYFEAYAHVAAKFGHSYSFEKVHTHLLGRAEEEGAHNMIRILGLPISAAELLKLRDERFLELLPSARPLPGAVAAMKLLHARGLPMAIATSSFREYLPAKRENNADLFACIDHVTCGDDDGVKGHSKPDPTIFLHSARQIGVPPEQCLAFEDSLAGIRSAKAAGMYVIAVPDSRLTAEQVREAAPDLVLRSLEDFTLQAVGL